jgi:hypothetical protein
MCSPHKTLTAQDASQCRLPVPADAFTTPLVGPSPPVRSMDGSAQDGLHAPPRAGGRGSSPGPDTRPGTTSQAGNTRPAQGPPACSNDTAAQAADEYLQSKLASASSLDCDLCNAGFVRLLIADFQAGRDHILRDGIAKALGLPGDVNEDERLVGESVNLGSSAIVDAYVSALAFSGLHSFSALQTQQVLLLLADTLDLLVTSPPDAETTAEFSPASASPNASVSCENSPNFSPADRRPSALRFPAEPTAGFGAAADAAAHDGRRALSRSGLDQSHAVTAPTQAAAASSQALHPLSQLLYHFTRKLHKMCSRQQLLVDERFVTVEDREEERVDPVAMAAYEAKLAKAKKGQTVDPPPKTIVRVTQETERFERKTINVGPYFSRAEMTALVEHFDLTVFQHWILFRQALTGSRNVVSFKSVVYIDDVPKFLAPLSAAVPLQDFTSAQARLDIESECDAARADVATEQSRLRDAIETTASEGRRRSVSVRTRSVWRTWLRP